MTSLSDLSASEAITSEVVAVVEDTVDETAPPSATADTAVPYPEEQADIALNAQIQQQDTPFKRKLFIELKLAEQEAYIRAIRERRLHAARKYESAKAAKTADTHDALYVKSEKKRLMIEKQLAKLDSVLDKLDGDINQYAAMVQVLGAITHDA